ncbi:hypothetical protein [Synechocystis sp. PCC 7338]|uniref:hypothetical protein n=1 Tax=Synechocystis sp. PCC 7338 TaxID=2732530 RepID=UPI001BB0D732|nr:hypothetical protein [Synechocystis sp. PCC 7338]QUS61831.1 hypothetical protein HTZ78_14950 [Synechocystis sp. PCC 7338]
MKTIEAIATISANGHIQLSQVEHLPIGKFKVVLVIDESIDSQDLKNSSLSSLENIAPNYQTSNWDNLAQEIDQKSSLSQQEKLKNLLISWLEEGDQSEQIETLKVMLETEEVSI